jgi:hypothetical protein
MKHTHYVRDVYIRMHVKRTIYVTVLLATVVDDQFVHAPVEPDIVPGQYLV